MAPTLVIALALASCRSPPPEAEDPASSETEVPLDTGRPRPTRDFWLEEEAHRDELLNLPFVVSGSVVDRAGSPLAGAEVRLDEVVDTTAADGTFQLEVASRRNQLLHVEASGYRPTVVALQLVLPASVDTVQVDPVPLSVADPDVVRFLFVGDTAFGRRFLDPDESTPRDQLPPDDPEALVQVSDPGNGSIDVVSRVEPLFALADLPILNLESPVTDDPSTPHWEKSYAFFTLPGSLEAVRYLGVPYVSTGNNHVYDYLDLGVTDTLRWLDLWGILTSGAGLDADEAFEPARMDVGGHPWSFLSLTSVSGSQHTIGYLATEGQGGAASLLEDEPVSQAIGGELARGRTPVLLLHTGKEYTYAPTDYARDRMDFVVAEGAALVVAHHTHVAQGFALVDGVLQVHCLGNFAFDQDRHETFLGLAAFVDLEGPNEQAAFAYPLYLEDYRPRLATGALERLFLLRIAEFSDPTELWVVPYLGQAWVLQDEAEVRTERRSLRLEVELDERGAAVVDLRPHLQGYESVEEVAVISGAAERLRIGRDLLYYGSFEDEDVDETDIEAARWDITGMSTDVCTSRAHTGAASLCSARSSANISDSISAFRNRVRVMGDAENTPNKELTFLVWAHGENAGHMVVESGYYASEGALEFGREIAFDHPGGTFDWTLAWKDLAMPPDDPGKVEDPTANARALRVFLRHSPPEEGDGVASYDDFAFIAWEEEVTPQEPLRVPHARQFLRVEGAPGTVELELLLAELRPTL